MFPHYGNFFDINDQKVTFQVTIFENSNQLKFNYKRNIFTNYYMSASVGFKFLDDTFLAMNYGSVPNNLNSTSTSCFLMAQRGTANSGLL